MLVRKDVDNTVRWKPGERLDHYFEQRCDSVPENHLAVVTEDVSLTFRQLDARANQAARFFLSKGIKAGDRIGVLFDKTINGHVALLGLMKMGAAYVPLDPSFPADRVAYIIEDAGIKTLCSVSRYAEKLADYAVEKIYLDRAAPELDALPDHRLDGAEKPSPDADQLFYIIYTSGTTGKPKGVVLKHAGICNFVKVAGEIYGYSQDDRCYQGMTLAFDFHVEDLWTPLVNGATLIAGKSGANLFGADLHAFLSQQHVTVLPCVPTLWATIEEELPLVRIILLSGEAVPHNLVVKWHREGRRILNAYGPTECSVSSTLRVLTPENPVTIGTPLPTYMVVILDENEPRELADGETGEIGIAGICLAEGYLNREDLTAKKFIPDFLDLPNNPPHRIYRTGDLGRIRPDGEIDFQGRIDTQVKLRGYRIELGEIEAVLAQLPQVSQAVVNPYETEPGTTELVAYYTRKAGMPEVSMAEAAETLKRQLPPYMIPGYLEEVAAIPMTTNNKADRRALPAPKGPRFSVSSTAFVGPRNATETALVAALTSVMKIDKASVTDNFFQDLGAHSLLMARFGAEIRKELNIPAVSMRDIYLNPTIEKLAVHLETMLAETSDMPPPVSNRENFHYASDFDYWLCGALQLAWFVIGGVVGLTVLVWGILWSYAAMPDYPQTFLRVMAFLIATYVVFSAIPIAVKWIFMGRFKAEAIPVWSLRYFRFWAVKASIRTSPMGLVEGPLRNLYMRLLGAKVGVNSVIQSPLVPVCSDLITVGDNSIIARETVFQGYKARSGYIFTGPITIGNNVSVGEAAALDINTVMEDDTQLAHASSLQEGQRVARGKHFHGTPAIETTANYCDIEPMDCSATRRWTYSLIVLLGGMITVTIGVLIAYAVFPYLWHYVGRWAIAFENPSVRLFWRTWRMVYLSLGGFFGALLVGLLAIGIVPRLLNLFLKPNKTYVAYGFHYFIHQSIIVISNSVFFNRLFGDSSAIVHYVRWVGYKLNTVTNTGSNFGLAQRHENPFLCDIGSGTIISGGLKMINETMCASSFKLGLVKIADKNYLGNYLHIPPDIHVGENVLIATKALAPIDGPIREHTGLLGSPPFEIPRATSRDLEMSQVDDETRIRQLHKKNRHNFVTAVLYLLSNWFLVFMEASFGLLMYAQYPEFGLWAVYVISAVGFLAGMAWMWVVERGVLKFGQLEPKIVPLRDPYFWFHERNWKLTGLWFVAPIFSGTPFKNIISKMEGVHLGKKVFDDGAYFDEYTLITIGDYSTLNSFCVIQPHSLEETVFKSGRVKMGQGCTLGCASNLHYDITMGDFVAIEQNAFVMKGEIIDDDETWRGNPARSAGARKAAAAAVAPVAVKAVA